MLGDAGLGAQILEALALAGILAFAVVVARLAVGLALARVHAVTRHNLGSAALGKGRAADGGTRQSDQGGGGGKADSRLGSVHDDLQICRIGPLPTQPHIRPLQIADEENAAPDRPKF